MVRLSSCLLTCRPAWQRQLALRSAPQPRMRGPRRHHCCQQLTPPPSPLSLPPRAVFCERGLNILGTSVHPCINEGSVCTPAVNDAVCKLLGEPPCCNAPACVSARRPVLGAVRAACRGAVVQLLLCLLAAGQGAAGTHRSHLTHMAHSGGQVLAPPVLASPSLLSPPLRNAHPTHSLPPGALLAPARL